MAERKTKSEATAPKRDAVQALTPEAMVAKFKETTEAVARRAFEIFESSGRRIGRNLADWLEAEEEVIHPVHVSIADSGAALTVTAEVPGFSLTDLRLRVEPQRVTISGERESRRHATTEQLVYSERCANRILRVVTLPTEVAPEAKGRRARCDKGILTLVLPKAKAPPATRRRAAKKA